MCAVSDDENSYTDNHPLRIDLTAGSRAYLLEPQWKPMVEEQALSRIHRIGQTKKVKTIRPFVRNSFEEVRDGPPVPKA
jgi:hypothetical protein